MSKWIMPSLQRGGNVQLFCFPFAGGGASAYRTWLRQKTSELEVAAIQLPGRENRIAEPLLYDMKSVIDSLVDELPRHITRPYAFFGHSLGARMAFEVARALSKRGHQPPAHIFVSGSRSPEIPEPRPLHKLTDNEFCEELGRFGGTPRELMENPELMALYLPILRADFTVDETYEYTADNSLPIPITAFCGSNDPEATAHEMLGWRNHTTAVFNFTQIEGDHFFIQTQWEKVLKLVTDTVQEGVCAEHFLAM